MQRKQSLVEGRDGRDVRLLCHRVGFVPISGLSSIPRRIHQPYANIRMLRASQGGKATVLSPLSNDAHDKSSHMLQSVDTLFLQFILFIQDFIWNRLSGVIDERVKGFSGGRDLSMAQARDAPSKLGRLPGQSFGVLEARITGEAGRE